MIITILAGVLTAFIILSVILFFMLLQAQDDLIDTKSELVKRADIIDNLQEQLKNLKEIDICLKK